VKAQVTPEYGNNHLIKNDPDDESDGEYYSANESDDSNQDPRSKILSAAELELMFVEKAPDLSGMNPLR